MVALILAIGAGITFLAGVIQGLVAWFSADQGTQKRLRPYIILSLIATFILIFASFLQPYISSREGGPSASSSPTAQLTETPTSQPTLLPTKTPIPTEVPTATEVPTQQPTPTRTVSGPKTLSENIPLQCTCSKPVVVTLRKVEIQPEKSRMVWTFTFYNSTSSFQTAYFGQLTLEEGDQIKYPTTGEATYDATGPGILNDGETIQIGVRPDQTYSVIVMFSFVPFENTPYTLISSITSSSSSKFDPIVMQFQVD